MSIWNSLKKKLSYEHEISKLIATEITLLKDSTTNPLRILDVGCGKTSMLAYFNSLEYRKSFHLIGLDVHAPTIDWCRINGFHDEYLLCDVGNTSEIPSVDIIIATDLIEHFDKDTALRLLRVLEEKASIGVFMTTPNGYIYNPFTSDNVFMEHKCGFSVQDLTSIGYVCLGLGGPKWMRGAHALPRRPKILTMPALIILSRLMRVFPQYSYHLFIKKIRPHQNSTD